MLTKNEFQEQALFFLQKLFLDLESKKIQIEPYWLIDHLCYRVETADQYIQMKKSLESWGKLLIESEVNGRMISTFKLNEGLRFSHWFIDVVELPAPKLGKLTKTGFEHIEVVADISFDSLIKRYSSHSLDLSGLEKDFNQELEIVLGLRNIKFHLLSLESVVCLESNKKVFSALKASNLLKDLKKYNPLVAGTFPLGLGTEKSDIDILLNAKDLDDLEIQLTEKWKSSLQFKCHRIIVDGRTSLVTQFTFQDVPFEIFAQNQESVLQNGYQHFLVEEKCLHVGGERFKQALIDLRQKKGLKTEPAFAQFLKLEGNPYDELLKLRKHDQRQLENLIYS